MSPNDSRSTPPTTAPSGFQYFAAARAREQVDARRITGQEWSKKNGSSSVTRPMPTGETPVVRGLSAANDLFDNYRRIKEGFVGKMQAMGEVGEGLELVGHGIGAGARGEHVPVDQSSAIDAGADDLF